MSEQTFAVDDDWGTGVAETEYPVLHSKQSVSKSVLRKRRKFAQKLQELSKSTVLPVVGKTPTQEKEKAPQEGQPLAKRQKTAKEQTNEPPSGPTRNKKLTKGMQDALSTEAKADLKTIKRKSKIGAQKIDASEADVRAEAGQVSSSSPSKAKSLPLINYMDRSTLSADKRSGESEPILEEGRNGGKKQDRKKKSFSQSTTSLSEGLVDLPRVQSKESEPSKKKQKEVKRQELEIAKESLIASGASARGRGQVLADSSLMAKMSKKLSGSKFRWLNETLYTSNGDDAFELMHRQPDLFKQYHEGFQQQTKSWPEQPLDAAIAWLRKLPKKLKVADFGCGDAVLAKSVKQDVISLDLVANSSDVIACNMSNTPLDAASVDVAVFCLALMGLDYPSFLTEATRILRSGGYLWIAEVRSRFAESQQEDFGRFVGAVKSVGYQLLNKNATNKMFVVFEFKKDQEGVQNQSSISWPVLKPCLYKRR